MKLMDIQCDPHIVDAVLKGIRTKELTECISDFVSYNIYVYSYVLSECIIGILY